MELPVVLTSKDANKQIDELLSHYNKLNIISSDEEKVVIQGTILIHRVYNDFPVYKEYHVEMVIYIDSFSIPSIKDIGKNIDTSFPHISADRILCLGLDSEIRFDFINHLSLCEWVEKYVETYYYSYEYYCRYGCMPFGERAHGLDAKYDFYKEFFEEYEDETLNKILVGIYNNKVYKPGLDCHCGSKRKIKECHPEIKKAYTNDKIYSIICNDSCEIMKGLGRWAIKNLKKYRTASYY